VVATTLTAVLWLYYSTDHRSLQVTAVTTVTTSFVGTSQVADVKENFNNFSESIFTSIFKIDARNFFMTSD
jgi:hypothetical protein